MARALPKDDLLDPRARLAAVYLLMAFDLPAEAGRAARQMIEAAKVLPGITMDKVPSLGADSRRRCYEQARALIDEMLA